MKLYRYITKEELLDIQKHYRLRFIHPKSMAKSESLITNFFEMNTILENNLKETIVKKKIRILVEKYRNSDPLLKTMNDYDMFTEIILMWYITNFYYCQCWSLEKNAWNIRKDDRVACITIDTDNLKKCICTDMYGKIYDMYLHCIDINYYNTKGQKRLETIFQEFRDSGRKIYQLITLLPEKFEYQNEVRIIASYKENTSLLGTYTLGSLATYLMHKYKLNMILDPKNDLIDALFLEARQCQIEIQTNELDALYLYFPPNFIEHITYHP